MVQYFELCRAGCLLMAVLTSIVLHLLLHLQICSSFYPTTSISSVNTPSTASIQGLTSTNKLIVGYANWNQCDDKLISAVEDGVNVLIWFSIDLSLQINSDGSTEPTVTRGPDMDCVADIISRIAAKGLNVVHLISIGGWNSPHPDTTHSVEDIYASWHTWNTQIAARPNVGFHGFDGIDWDVEGNDTPSSPYNQFTVSCLQLMGRFSQIAKQHGYIVAMAPAESYLDPTTSLFDRSLLHTYSEWDKIQPDFAYHGHNTYAYLLAKYGQTTVSPTTLAPTTVASTTAAPTTVDTFDFITVQLYEGYSHACYRIEVLGNSAAVELVNFALRVAAGWEVDFASDPALALPSCRVSIPPTRLVIGLANGWAGDGKFLFIHPSDVGEAYTHLCLTANQPRGFAFWNILDEGKAVKSKPDAPVWLARELNAFMKIRVERT